MNKEQFKEIVGNPKFIPGIFNYCDRWCERCELTAQCSVFAIEKAGKSGSELSDDENRVFWQQLKDTLETALELLKDFAQKTGIDLDPSLPEEEKLSKISKGEVTYARAGEQALVRQAREYMGSVSRWFKSVNMEAGSGLASIDAGPEDENFRETKQIILWYHTLIYVKLARAVQLENDEDSTSLGDMSDDAAGSVKVALTAMDRSLAAWWRMHGYFPKRKDQIVKLLLRLDHLRRDTEKAFPNARSFVRPGFDGEVEQA